MEGYTLLRTLRELLDESSTSTFLNDRTSYDYLYAAVLDFNKKTYYATTTQTITVIANTHTYNLNADFVTLALLDDYNRAYIKYTVSGNDYFIFSQDYGKTVLMNDSSTASVATSFSILDAPATANYTGTATANGVASAGECTLTDSTASFTYASPGDFVHNTTDNSHGIVVSKTSATQLVCALFEGSANQWTTGDAYVVVPQARYQIKFNPTPSASATATLTYVKKPDPVYSSYRAYRLPQDALLAIVKFAAFLYKYRDREPNYGDAFAKYYDAFTRKVAAELRKGIPGKSGMRVNMTKMDRRSTGTGQWR